MTSPHNSNQSPRGPKEERLDVGPFLDRCHGSEIERHHERPAEPERCLEPAKPLSLDEGHLPNGRDFCHGAEVRDTSLAANARGDGAAQRLARSVEWHELCILDLVHTGGVNSGGLLVKVVPAPYDESVQVLDFSALVSVIGRLDGFAAASGGAVAMPSAWAATFDAIDGSLDPRRDDVCRDSLSALAGAFAGNDGGESFGAQVKSALGALLEIRAHLERLSALPFSPFDSEVVEQLSQFFSTAIHQAGVRLGRGV